MEPVGTGHERRSKGLSSSRASSLPPAKEARSWEEESTAPEVGPFRLHQRTLTGAVARRSGSVIPPPWPSKVAEQFVAPSARNNPAGPGAVHGPVRALGHPQQRLQTPWFLGPVDSSRKSRIMAQDTRESWQGCWAGAGGREHSRGARVLNQCPGLAGAGVAAHPSIDGVLVSACRRGGCGELRVKGSVARPSMSNQRPS